LSQSERVGLSEVVWSVSLGDSAFRGVFSWEEFHEEKEARIFASVIKDHSSYWDVIAIDRLSTDANENTSQDNANPVKSAEYAKMAIKSGVNDSAISAISKEYPWKGEMKPYYAESLIPKVFAAGALYEKLEAS